MRISLKIFIFTYCIMVAVTVFGGFLLINHEYQKNLDQVKIRAQENNETLYTYVATIEELLDSERARYSLENLIDRISGESKREVLVGDYNTLLSQLVAGKATELESGQWVYAIWEDSRGKVLQITSRYEDRYIINYSDLSQIIRERDANYQLYKNIIIFSSVIIAIVLYLFSWYITRPLVKVTQMAERLCSGDYEARVDDAEKRMKSYEVQKLGSTLNLMAERTQAHMQELTEEARRKEEFMGNFAHEMKTPMTSIIGYADLLRTYDLKPEKRREYSNFIYNEGKRVEQLSLNLLQMIVLEKEDFEKKRTSVEEFFKQLKDSAHFLGEKYGLKIRYKYDPADIFMEKSLMLTAILNLVDNACKASLEGESVYVLGKRLGEKYAFAIVDFGVGIPEEEIARIMEPFYMVDKSRARKQGGAGLGLSLCQRIIRMHNGELHIDSTPGKGTWMTVLLDVEERASLQEEPKETKDADGKEPKLEDVKEGAGQ